MNVPYRRARRRGSVRTADLILSKERDRAAAVAHPFADQLCERNARTYALYAVAKYSGQREI